MLFLKGIGKSFLRLVYIVGAIETFSWLYDEDQVVHEFTRNNKGLVSLILVVYLIYDYLIYEIIQSDYENEYESKINGKSGGV